MVELPDSLMVIPRLQFLHRNSESRIQTNGKRSRERVSLRNRTRTTKKLDEKKLEYGKGIPIKRTEKLEISGTNYSFIL